METNTCNFLNVDANKVSGSHALELRRTATQVPLPCPVYCSLGLWVLAKTNHNKAKQFCELVTYLTLDRLLSESGRAISRNLLVLIIVQ